MAAASALYDRSVKLWRADRAPLARADAWWHRTVNQPSGAIAAAAWNLAHEFLLLRTYGPGCYRSHPRKTATGRPGGCVGRGAPRRAPAHPAHRDVGIRLLWPQGAACPKVAPLSRDLRAPFRIPAA